MSANILGGRYQIIRGLGCGGFGKTYVAEDSHLPGKPHCVVKQFKPRTTDIPTLQIARRLFDTEAEVLYKLGKHDQIPQLFAHFEENEEFYLVQEYVEGNSLCDEILPGHQLDEDFVVSILQEILTILEFVHQQRVIHRDIKPSNLIRRKHDNKIVLIDFGAVKEIGTTTVDGHCQTTMTVTVGSPGYMPNEQLAGNPRFCSDIYAVGMIGIQALTGLDPKKLKKDANTDEIIWREWAQVSPGLAYVLDKMVRYDFRQRYQSATSALGDLKNLSSYASGMMASTIVTRTPTQIPNSGRKTPSQISTQVGTKKSNSISGQKTPSQISTKVATSNSTSTVIEHTQSPKLNEIGSTIVANNNKLKPNWIWFVVAGILALLGTQIYSYRQLQSLIAKSSSPTPQVNLQITSPTPQASAIASPSPTPQASAIASPSPTPQASAIATPSPTTQASAIATPSPTPQASAIANVDPTKSAEAKRIVGLINSTQQLFYLENNRFASTWQDLKLNIESRTEDYDYEIIWGDRTKALVTATAKNPGLKSYSGVVSMQGETVVDKICETNEPSTAPPRIPQAFGKDFQCPYGSTGVSGLL
ncbi:type IV pilin-like G/H family protein [Aerosakkonema sp. BLCC-F183]|uniref:protein kinase domain-containing protein n=1 Tax=Aerosakkonema sp. BLCC-F183 TaxID=3342834 RepID=UPI0035B70CC4